MTFDKKDQICEIFSRVAFRRFGNAFRKHIDYTFARKYHLAEDGGLVDKDFTWNELASYIIGDGEYAVSEEQFNSFMQEFEDIK